MMVKLFKILLAIATIAAVSACGGGLLGIPIVPIL